MKYMGSKARLAKHILPLILEGRAQGQVYVEPFAGGMNLLSQVTGPRLGSDISTPLISMWQALLDGWQPPEVTRAEYERVRANKAHYPLAYVGWVGFNCSYSGKYFGGFAGKTKTRLGTVRDYQAEALRNVVRQVAGLQGATLLNLSYERLPLPPRSLIYCDPPYQGTTGYSSDFDHARFWQWARDMAAAGHSVFVSEYQAPADFVCVWAKEVSSSLSANGRQGGNKVSIERLFKPAGRG